MRSGPMRHVVQIQAMTETADSFGQPVQSWATVATVRGLMEPLSGRELVNARQVKADVTTRLTTRWQGSTALLPTMQVVFEGDTYKVSEVLDINMRHKEIHILLTKVVVPTP